MLTVSYSKCQPVIIKPWKDLIASSSAELWVSFWITVMKPSQRVSIHSVKLWKLHFQVSPNRSSFVPGHRTKCFLFQLVAEMTSVVLWKKSTTRCHLTTWAGMAGPTQPTRPPTTRRSPEVMLPRCPIDTRQNTTPFKAASFSGLRWLLTSPARGRVETSKPWSASSGSGTPTDSTSSRSRCLIRSA